MHNNLTKTFKSQNYVESFLESIKIYFKLDDIRVISQEELVRDEELSLLFKDKLEELASSLYGAEEDISALHEVLYNKEENNKKNIDYMFIYYRIKKKLKKPKILFT